MHMKLILDEIEKSQNKKIKSEDCKSLEHNPPSFLYIPSNETHKYKCSHCGKETILKGEGISF